MLENQQINQNSVDNASNSLDSVSVSKAGLLSNPAHRPKKQPGDPKGSYTMSEKALEVRSRAGFLSQFKHGWVSGANSRVMERVASCHVCPVRDFCDYKEVVQMKGCDLVRQKYLTNLLGMGEPITVLMKRLAELETMLEIQSFRDGSSQAISKEYLELTKLSVDLAKALTKLKRDDGSDHVMKSFKILSNADDSIELSPIRERADEMSNEMESGVNETKE